MIWILLLFTALLVGGYALGVQRAGAVAEGDVRRLHSRPTYYGWSVALTAAVPPLLIFALYALIYPRIGGISPNIGMIVLALMIVAGLAGLAFSYTRISPELRARNVVEMFVYGFLIACAVVAIMTTVAIVLSLVTESIAFFRIYPWQDFFFGTTWESVTHGTGRSRLGILPLLWGTLYISFIALVVAVPIGLFAAIYMAEYASRRVRSVAKPVVEVLAG
ncbi:MAG: phosphate ABC transporter permease family protein, partial [Paracoccus sp. (in: a-proteobacteria)]|nr:phosphate ABC transporter permease family protein [Paracoccus sp. (in: a-proteobacteria)]